MKRGKLIEITGIDGCGKTTQSKLLNNYFITKGIPSMLIESGSSSLVGGIIKRINSEDILVAPFTRALIYAVDYSCLLSEKIIPALKEGIIVIMDRYLYSSIAYNTALGCDMKWSETLYSFAIWPDIVIWIDTNPEVCYERIMKERGKFSVYEVGLGSGKNRENFLVFQNKVRSVYLQLAQQNKDIKVINGNGSVDKVHLIIKRIIMKEISK